MVNRTEPLATRLQAALDDAGLTVEVLADRTKVPRSTLRALLGEEVAVLLPARVYLKGHLCLAARELGIDEDEVKSLFDKTYPVVAEDSLSSDLPRLKFGTVAMTAGLAGVAILAVILAFVG